MRIFQKEGNARESRVPFMRIFQEKGNATANHANFLKKLPNKKGTQAAYARVPIQSNNYFYLRSSMEVISMYVGTTKPVFAPSKFTPRSTMSSPKSSRK